MLPRTILLGGCLLLLCPPATRGEATLHAIFSDNMVLQRGIELPVWGTAEPNEEVYVHLEVKSADGKKEEGRTAKAGSDGTWVVKLGQFDQGTDGKLTVKDAKKTLTLKNVLIGEVWVCSGQSNMEWSVISSTSPEETVKNSKNPMVRLFTVTKHAVPEPQTGFGKPAPNRQWEDKWLECGPESTPPFSAVAYHFGVSMAKARNVPIGLIHTSWGGTPAEAWTSKEVLLAEPSLKYYVERLEQAKKNYDPDRAKKQHEEAMVKWKEAAEKAKEGKKNPPNPPRLQGPPGTGSNDPSSLYNGMIAPLLPFPIQGAIWYQGESNNGRAYEYRTLFPAMIEDWRQRWGYEFPFFCVQLAPFLAALDEDDERQKDADQDHPEVQEVRPARSRHDNHDRISPRPMRDRKSGLYKDGSEAGRRRSARFSPRPTIRFVSAARARFPQRRIGAGGLHRSRTSASRPVSNRTHPNGDLAISLPSRAGWLEKGGTDERSINSSVPPFSSHQPPTTGP